MKKINPVYTKLQWFSSVDQGRQLEVLAVDESGTLLPNHCYPLITLLKDDMKEELHIELYTEKGTVQIRAKDLKEALALAEEDTHSEQWYEENVYSRINTEE